MWSCYFYLYIWCNVDIYKYVLFLMKILCFFVNVLMLCVEILDGVNVLSNYQILVCLGIFEVFFDYFGDVGDFFYLVDCFVF